MPGETSEATRASRRAPFAAIEEPTLDAERDSIT